MKTDAVGAGNDQVFTASAETVLVGGATGRQGNAVVDELLARGYEVRGLTRKPDGKKGVRLAEKGVEVVKTSYTISETLVSRLKD